MKRMLPLAAALVLIAASLPLIAADYELPFTDASFLRDLNGEAFEACGLNKLDEAEFDQLCSIFSYSYASGASYLESSALRYLEENGWTWIQVLGPYDDPDRISKDRVIAAVNGRVCVMELWGVGPVPLPGLYWAKLNISTGDLLLPDGKTRFFDLED